VPDSKTSLLNRLTKAPLVADQKRAKAQLKDFIGRVRDEPEAASLLQHLDEGLFRDLLLGVADHSPFGSAAKELSATFGVTMYLLFARDDLKHAGWDNERLVFSNIATDKDGKHLLEGETTVTFTENLKPAGVER